MVVHCPISFLPSSQLQEFTKRDWGKPRNTSATTVGVQAQIWTYDFLNTKQGYYILDLELNINNNYIAK